MDPKTDKLVRRTTMIATATASYLLLTADYGPEPNFLDPVTTLTLFNFLAVFVLFDVICRLELAELLPY